MVLDAALLETYLSVGYINIQAFTIASLIVEGLNNTFYMLLPDRLLILCYF